MKATQVWREKKEVDNLTQELIYLHWHFFYKWKPIRVAEALDRFKDKAEQILREKSLYYIKLHDKNEE